MLLFLSTRWCYRNCNNYCRVFESSLLSRITWERDTPPGGGSGYDRLDTYSALWTMTLCTVWIKNPIHQKNLYRGYCKVTNINLCELCESSAGNALSFIVPYIAMNRTLECKDKNHTSSPFWQIYINLLLYSNLSGVLPTQHSYVGIWIDLIQPSKPSISIYTFLWHGRGEI